MDTRSPANITRLLQEISGGRRQAVDELISAIYDDLRALAEQHMRRERTGHTLQATALVHEAWLKLIDQRWTLWRDRLHFFAAASEVIRRLLVDHARARRTAKRGGRRPQLTLHEVVIAMDGREIDLVEINDALERLAAVDATRARIVELRFFGGLPLEQVAELLDLSVSTVKRKWGAAQAWLYRELVEPA